MAFVSNPVVPYVGPIVGLQSGGILQIAGHIPPHAKWFAINLQCGPNTHPRDDIALHMNPRFEANLSKVVRNSLQSQQWGVEENFGHFPFAAGQQFELLVLTEPDHFKIAINGQHYTEFRHRIPVQRVNTLAVDGDVQLFTIRYEAPSSSSSAPPLPPLGVPPQSSGGYGFPGQQGASYGHPGTTSSGAYGPPAGLVPPGGPYPSQAPPPYYHQQSPSPMHGSGQASSSPLPVPGTTGSPMYQHGRSKSSSMLPGIATGAGAGVLAGAAAYGLSRLMYPHGTGGGHYGGFGGKVKGMKGMKGMKHKSHKPKFHKFHKQKGFKHKGHKGWKHGGSGSSSSSSSEEE